MAQRLKRHEARRPRPRVSDQPGKDGYFFPGEVAELLGCRDIDYHQLRRLFRLVRVQADQPVRPRKWARFTLRDIAAMRVALDLCGGISALEEGHRLRIAPLERACAALRRNGVANPLLDVPMRREGRTIFAEIDGSLFDPVSGQQRLDTTLDLLHQYLNGLEVVITASERKGLAKVLQQETKQTTRARDAAHLSGGVPIY